MKRGEQAGPDGAEADRSDKGRGGRPCKPDNKPNTCCESSEMEGQMNQRGYIAALLKRAEKVAVEQRPMFKNLFHYPLGQLDETSEHFDCPVFNRGGRVQGGSWKQGN